MTQAISPPTNGFTYRGQTIVLKFIAKSGTHYLWRRKEHIVSVRVSDRIVQKATESDLQEGRDRMREIIDATILNEAMRGITA